MMLVIYDITDDKTRTRVADACLDYGLARLQYSSFIGNLSRTHREELLMRLKRTLGRHPGVIQSFNICQSCWAEHITCGTPLISTADRTLKRIENEIAKQA